MNAHYSPLAHTRARVLNTPVCTVCIKLCTNVDNGLITERDQGLTALIPLGTVSPASTPTKGVDMKAIEFRIVGYRRGSDTRCLAHVDFSGDGVPVYTAFDCTYCGEEWARGQCVKVESTLSGAILDLHLEDCEHQEVTELCTDCGSGITGRHAHTVELTTRPREIRTTRQYLRMRDGGLPLVVTLDRREERAYRTYVQDNLADTDGHFAPLSRRNWLATLGASQ